MRSRTVCLLAIVTLVVSGSAHAQTPAASVEAEPYVVKPGDTLENLAQRTYGDQSVWSEIWKANPQVKDPHMIRPGETILLPKQRSIAEIKQMERRVDTRAHPEPDWAKARLGDRLKRRDGLRTYRSSSAQLAFEDGSELTVGEESLIFVRERAAPAKNVSRQAIEIVEGQGDLTSPGKTGATGGGDIEIVMGSARARPVTTAEGGAWSRARQTAGAPAQLMVYNGASEVEAAGARVAVGTGMGTSIAPGHKPGAPEKLLPAPVRRWPSSGSAFEYSNVGFRWDPVSGASAYVIEFCADPACARLVRRSLGLRQNEWIADGLPVGDFYWRVTAQSASGLDGYPSEPGRLSVRSLWRRPERAPLRAGSSS